jgi:cell division protein ZapA (FtsZ GTPase activity inhibitor)
VSRVRSVFDRPVQSCVGNEVRVFMLTAMPFTDELVNEKEKYKSITDELDQTFSELSGY